MTISTWEAVSAECYILSIFVCGYESRASYVSEQKLVKSETNIILDYECYGALSYDKNKNYFSKLPTVHFLNAQSSIEAELAALITKSLSLQDPERPATILFDVSSCSRSLMAAVLLVLARTIDERVSVTITYALSSFVAPPEGELPSHISEPVVGDLAGWSDDLSKPPCAVIGLGFEPGRALGCMDYLEIPEVRLFMPQGADERFEHAVVAANSVLIQEAGETYVLPYNVLDPSSAYQKLESLIYGLLPNFRPVLIPLGPKIFAALSILLAIKLSPQVCVWRTSSGPNSELSDIKANGDIATFSTTLFDSPSNYEALDPVRTP